MNLDYHSRNRGESDWQGIAAPAIMAGGALGSVGIGLWAIYVPKADPLLLFPLLGCFGMLVCGVVWWMLNRRGLS